MATFMRFVSFACARCAPTLKLRPAVMCNYVRHYKPNKRYTYKDFYERRIEQGPEPLRHRSEWLWNYDAEVYAFGKRLGEEFNEATLKQAFTHQSYVEKEERQRAELGMDEESLSLGIQHNQALAENGEKLCQEYISAYLRDQLPNLPEEGVSAITEFLMSTETLQYIASNLGVNDLILCKEFPASEETITKTFKAVIGALAENQGDERAHLFIQDFVLTHLIGKTLDEIWKIPDPMGVLNTVVRAQNCPEPEPRLMWQSASGTIEACYMVGIYVNKQLIGKAPGETVTIAEEMAARDALRSIFGLDFGRKPFKFGTEGHKLQIDLQKLNSALADIKLAELQ